MGERMKERLNMKKENDHYQCNVHKQRKFMTWT